MPTKQGKPNVAKVKTTPAMASTMPTKSAPKPSAPKVAKKK